MAGNDRGVLGVLSRPEKKAQSTLPGFIPIACHYSPDTILTKNGELLQVIRVETEGGEAISEFRDKIREAVSACITSRKFAVWIHTVRAGEEERKQSPKRPDNLAAYLDSRLGAKSEGRAFRNSVYITILRDGHESDEKFSGGFLTTLSYRAEVRHHNRVLSEAADDLDYVSGGVLEALSSLGARKLGFYEEGEIYHSEIMEFYYRLLSMDAAKIPVPLSDLSKTVIPGEFSFASFEGELKISRYDEEVFAAVISLKEYVDLSAKAASGLFELDRDFIVYDALEFVSRAEAVSALAHYKYVADVGEDTGFMDVSGFSALTGTSRKVPMEFVKRQTSIVMFAKSKHELLKSIELVNNKLAAVGIVSFREDLRMEHAFWASLPGNFSFLKRQHVARSEFVGLFALPVKAAGLPVPGGRDADTRWGDVINVFDGLSDEKFPFSFHHPETESGNTVIAGMEPSQALLIADFLALRTQRLGVKIIYLDITGEASAFALASGAEMMDYEKYRPGEIMASGFFHFDFSRLMEDEDKAEEAVLHIMQEIEDALTGAPALVVINSIDRLLLSERMAEHIAYWLEEIAARNAAVMALWGSFPPVREECGQELLDVCRLVLSRFPTRIFTATRPENIWFTKEMFAVPEEEAEVIEVLDDETFLISQAGETVVARIALDKLPINSEVLSPAGISSRKVAELFKKAGGNIESFLSSVAREVGMKP